MLNNGKQIKKNVALSMMAQLVSLLVSCILSLVVPKTISEAQYAQWQTYVLYVSYVGILHFGLLDGIVLRYAQYDYDQLDKKKLRSQFVVLSLILSASAVGMFLLSFFIQNKDTKTIIALVAIGTITKNVFTYTSYLFQITNRINEYVKLLLLQRLCYGLGVLMLMMINAQHYWLLCIMDLLADIVAIVYGANNNQGLFFGSIPDKETIQKELKKNVSSGSLLLIANWSSMFLIGSARMIVQWHWDLLTFGKVSFAFSISNLFLAFVTAASVVLFPSLKRMDVELLPKVYMRIRNVISPALFVCMIGYYPGCLILRSWLPAYNSSLIYLGILLPTILYTSKVSLLTNNYLKAYRKERILLIINIIFVFIGVSLFLACALIIDKLSVLLICVVFVVMARSIVSELVVSRIIGVSLLPDFCLEVLLTYAFIAITWNTTAITGVLAYTGCVVIYLLICWHKKGFKVK